MLQMRRMIESLECEIALLQKLHHPNIVQYISTERTVCPDRHRLAALCHPRHHSRPSDACMAFRSV